MRAAIVALVPVKDLSQAKSRLAPHLSPAERSTLAQCMLRDVLSVLVRIPELITAIVTNDPLARQITAEFNVYAIADQGSGETAVIQSATRDIVRQGAAGSLVIPGDVPLLTVQEVLSVLAAGTS